MIANDCILRQNTYVVEVIQVFLIQLHNKPTKVPTKNVFCNRGATFVARRAPSEGALPIPFAMVPSFPRRVQSLHHNTLVAKVWPSGAARNSA